MCQPESGQSWIARGCTRRAVETQCCIAVLFGDTTGRGVRQSSPPPSISSWTTRFGKNLMRVGGGTHVVHVGGRKRSERRNSGSYNTAQTLGSKAGSLVWSVNINFKSDPERDPNLGNCACAHSCGQLPSPATSARLILHLSSIDAASSQAWSHAARAVTGFPTSAELMVPAPLFRVLLLRRLRLLLPVAQRTCACRGRLHPLGDHRAACATSGVLASRALLGRWRGCARKLGHESPAMFAWQT